jgi:hypothetical protein
MIICRLIVRGADKTASQREEHGLDTIVSPSANVSAGNVLLAKKGRSVFWVVYSDKLRKEAVRP